MGSTSCSNNHLTQAAPFPVPSYSDDHIASAWEGIHAKFPKSVSSMSRFFNVFTFARGAILAFEENNIEEPSGKRGTLIFTGATASTRSNVVTSAFTAGKLGARALLQSLAKGKYSRCPFTFVPFYLVSI